MKKYTKLYILLLYFVFIQISEARFLMIPEIFKKKKQKAQPKEQVEQIHVQPKDEFLVDDKKRTKEEILLQYQEVDNEKSKVSEDESLAKMKKAKKFKFKPYLGVEHIVQNFSLVATGLSSASSAAFRAIERDVEIKELGNTKVLGRGVSFYGGVKMDVEGGLFVALEAYFTTFYYNDPNGIDVGVGIDLNMMFKNDFGGRINMGFNLGDKFSVYGILGAGALNATFAASGILEMSQLLPFPFYGAGATFSSKKFDLNVKYIQRANFEVDKSLVSELPDESLLNINAGQYVVGLSYKIFA